MLRVVFRVRLGELIEPLSGLELLLNSLRSQPDLSPRPIRVYTCVHHRDPSLFKEDRSCSEPLDQGLTSRGGEDGL